MAEKKKINNDEAVDQQLEYDPEFMGPGVENDHPTNHDGWIYSEKDPAATFSLPSDTSEKTDSPRGPEEVHPGWREDVEKIKTPKPKGREGLSAIASSIITGLLR